MIKLLSMSLLVLLSGTGAIGAKHMPLQNALSLRVAESEHRVTVELVSQAAEGQNVKYDMELTGTSRSRTSGSTVTSGEAEQTLARLSTSFDDTWCVQVNAQDGAGDPYRLTAGHCET